MISENLYSDDSVDLELKKRVSEAEALEEQDSDKERFKISFNDSRVKFEVKDKGHKKGRMKITIKLSQTEGDSFFNFLNMIKPDSVPQDTFIKSIFLKGVQKLQEELSEAINDYAEENPGQVEEMVRQAEEEGEVEVLENETVATEGD